MATKTEFTYHIEIINGQEREKPLSGPDHALIQSHLTVALYQVNITDHYFVMPELNVACGKNGQDRLVPDISVVSVKAEYRGVDLMRGPALAAEISSPGQTFLNLVDKCERLIDCGTGLCWIVLPETRKAWHYDADRKLNEVAQLAWPLNEPLIFLPLNPLFDKLHALRKLA